MRSEIALQSEGTQAQVESAVLSALARTLGVSESRLAVAALRGAARRGGRRLAAWAVGWRCSVEGDQAADDLLGSAASMSSDPRGSLADELASSFGALGVAFDAGSLLVTEPVLEVAGPTPAPTPSPLASTPTAVPTPAPTAWPTVLPALAPSAALSPELSEEDEELVLATMSDIEDQEKKILDSVFGNVSAVDDRVDGDGVVTVKPARVKATAVGITSAVALDADAVNRSGAAAVEVSVEDGAAQAVRVQVPVEVIMQTAGSSEGDGAGVIVGISVTVMSAASRFPGMETASAQASIVLQRKDGEPLSGVELSKPVRIVLLPSKSEGLVCAWWDPASMKWSVYGVKEFVHDGAELICATNHLSIFTVLPHVVKTLGTALVCSNTKVFSAEVFQQATRDTGWLYGLHGLFYLSLVSVTVVLLMLSSYLDSRWRRRYKWTDSNFCTQNDTFRTEKVSIAKRVWEFVASLLDVSQISRSLTYHALAYEERFAARSIEVLVKGPLEADGRSSQGIARAFRRGGERVDEAVDNILEVAGQAVGATGRAVEVIRDSVTSRGSMRPAVRLRRQRCVSFDVAREVPDLLSTKAVVLCDTFWGSRPWWRLWVIFLAVNKWIRWHHYSIYERSTTRCLLLTGHMWGAVLAIAVFSEQTGSSLSYGSDAECETEDFWEKLQMDIAVGFLSAVISSAPTGLAQMILLRRRFVYQSDWEVIQQESYSRCWRAQERTLIAMLWVYICFCALFVWLFLASISAASRGHTIASIVSSVASNVLVNPLVVSLALLTVAAVHQRRDPDALNNIKGDMRKQFEVEAEEIVFDPISVPEDGRCCAEPDAEPDVLGDVPVSKWAPPLPPLPLPGCPDACEDDSLGIVFDLPYDQVRHDVFIGALRDGLRGMGVGENGLDKVHVALYERPAGGTVARLSGPVSVIVEIGVMNLAERLEVMAWRPSGTQPSAHRERDDGQLYDVLDGDRLVEAELRARLDAAEAHDQAMQRSLDSAIGLSLNSTGALTQVPRGCCARQIASFAGAVERLWLEKGQTLLQELRGNLRQAGGAMACWGSRAAELDAEPLELWTLGLVCRKARSAHAHRTLNAEFQGHLLAVFCWLVGAMRGVDIDRLLGH